jgi:rhodanese-related sulfurtransferase
MGIQTIQVDELAKIASSGPIDLIDVRTPAEFEAVRAKAARLFPLDTLDPNAIAGQRTTAEDRPLYLICKLGGRSMKACEQFVAAGIPNVVNVTGGTDAWVAAGHPSIRGERRGIALDRQVRIAAGLLVLTGVLLSLVNPNFVWLAGFIGAGLVFSGVTDTCTMGTILSKMPWNRA